MGWRDRAIWLDLARQHTARCQLARIEAAAAPHMEAEPRAHLLRRLRHAAGYTEAKRPSRAEIQANWDELRALARKQQ